MFRVCLPPHPGLPSTCNVTRSPTLTPPPVPSVSVQIKRLMRGNNENASLQVQERFVAGSLAGATAQTIIYPMEVRVHGCPGLAWLAQPMRLL